MNQSSTFIHDRPEKLGILLLNLGTPDAPDRTAVRRYLKEFLWDPRVVEGPRLAWWLALNGIILNTRPKRSAAAYKKIWTPQGSPLLVISRQQQAALQALIGDPLNAKVTLAMRYGNPSIKQGLLELQQMGARQILILPLYPQYSATTTASIFDAVAAELKQWRWLPELRFINHYPDHPGYIEALANSVKTHWHQQSGKKHLVMSFHGIPQEYFDKGDPYYCECLKTGRLLAEALALDASDWTISFQSRLGPKAWLQPYTDETLKSLAKNGTKDIQIVCPGFSADCLETLEEIAMKNRDIFLAAGGKSYEYIPCLNDQPAHIAFLGRLIQQHTANWATTLPDNRHQVSRKPEVAMEEAN